MKLHRIGIDLGEWLGLIPIVGRPAKAARALKDTPKGPERRAAVKALVVEAVEDLTDWLDNALDD